MRKHAARLIACLGVVAIGQLHPGCPREMAGSDIGEVFALSHSRSLFVQVASFIDSACPAGDLCASAHHVELSRAIARPGEMGFRRPGVSGDDRKLIEKAARWQRLDPARDGLLGGGARLFEAPEATVSVRQIRIGKRVRRIPPHRFPPFLDRALEPSEEVVDQRQAVDRLVIVGKAYFHSSRVSVASG